MGVPSQPSQWMAQLDERTNKHVAYARHYAEHFAHGAPGHLDLMTIAALARLLDQRSAPQELLTPAEQVKADTTRPPDASKRPGGFA